MHLPSIALLSFVAVASAGCASNTGMSYCQAVSYSPEVAILYPVPNATGVAAASGVLVYATLPNGGGAGGAVPISLAFGSGAPVVLKSAAVPSPLPSPAATPYPGAQEFAVALPTLAPATTYHVFAQQMIGGCFTGTTTNPAGTFTTE